MDAMLAGMRCGRLAERCICTAWNGRWSRASHGRWKRPSSSRAPRRRRSAHRYARCALAAHNQDSIPFQFTKFHAFPQIIQCLQHAPSWLGKNSNNISIYLAQKKILLVPGCFFLRGFQSRLLMLKTASDTCLLTACQTIRNRLLLSAAAGRWTLPCPPVACAAAFCYNQYG